MLHVIREFALERLTESGEADAVCQRHLAAYTELAESIAPHVLGADRKSWLDRFEADHDNVRSALDWAVANGHTDRALRLGAASWRFWQSRGHLHEAQRRLDAALALPGADPAYRAKGLEALAGVQWWRGDIVGCLATYRDALAIQRDLGDPSEIANAIYNVALAASAAGYGEEYTDEDREAAAREVFGLFDEAEALYGRVGNVGGLGDVAWGRGNAITYLRDYHPDALEQMKLSIDYYRRAGNEFGTGWGMYEVARFARHVEDPDTAWEYLAQGLELFAKHRDISAAVLFIALAAAIAQDGGDPLRAARLAGAYHALRIASGTNLVDHEINRVDGLDYETAEALGGERGEAYRQGCAMEFDDAVAYTLTGPIDPPDA
jgi:tetratricopeptide (TPR) repeat protein